MRQSVNPHNPSMPFDPHPCDSHHRNLPHSARRLVRRNAGDSHRGVPMFESELEMEKKQGGGFGPLLIILLLVGLVVGGLGYVVWQGKQTLKPEEAAQVITATLAEKGPASVRFHSGLVTYDVNDTTTDPHYRLLAKLGIVNTKPAKNGALQVDLTPQGEQ